MAAEHSRRHIEPVAQYPHRHLILLPAELCAPNFSPGSITRPWRGWTSPINNVGSGWRIKSESGTGPVSTRRLRKSIIAGRLLTPEELHPDPADRGSENHIPYVNRLVALWSRMKERRWLQRSTHEQRAASERNLRPVIEIYNRL